MIIFIPSAAAALVRLRCPSCGEIQARARDAKGYHCRKCRATIPTEQNKASTRRGRGK